MNVKSVIFTVGSDNFDKYEFAMSASSPVDPALHAPPARIGRTEATWACLVEVSTMHGHDKQADFCTIQGPPHTNGRVSPPKLYSVPKSTDLLVHSASLWSRATTAELKILAAAQLHSLQQPCRQ